MSRRFALALPVALGALVAGFAGVACNALTGAASLGVGGALGDDDELVDGGGPRGGDSSARDGTVVAVQGDGAVTPSLAACENNGLCMPNADGWTPALHVTIALPPACPPEWPQENDYQMSGGGSCECTCTPKGGSCEGLVQFKTGSMCSGGATLLATALDAGCVTADEPVPSPVALFAQPISPPDSCSGQVEPGFREPEKAVTCTGATMTASPSCDPGEVCVPKPSVEPGLPFPKGTVCMVHDGEVACPQKLPRRVVVGTSIADGRSCGASCACAPSDCKGGKVDTFGAANCVGLVRTYSVDGTCAPGASSAVATYRYRPGSACKVTQQAQVIGAETVTAPRTFCCPLLPF